MRHFKNYRHRAHRAASRMLKPGCKARDALQNRASETKRPAERRQRAGLILECIRIATQRARGIPLTRPSHRTR